MQPIQQFDQLLVVNHRGKGDKAAAEHMSFRLLAAAERLVKEKGGGAIYHDYRGISKPDDGYANEFGICFRKLRLLGDFKHVATIDSGMTKIMVSMATRKGGVEMDVFGSHNDALQRLKAEGYDVSTLEEPS